MEITNRKLTSPTFGHGFALRTLEGTRLSVTGAVARARIGDVRATGGSMGASAAPYVPVRFSEPHS